MPAGLTIHHGFMRTIYRSVTSGIDDVLGTSTTSMMDAIVERLSQQAAVGVIQAEDLVEQTLSDAQHGVVVGAASSSSSSPSSARIGEEGLTYFTAPICDLFVTVFELREKNNWLRRQAILIVLQQVLGGTIERCVSLPDSFLPLQKTLARASPPEQLFFFFFFSSLFFPTRLRPVFSKFRDSVKMLLAPTQVVSYIGALKAGLWPDGQLKPKAPPRTAEEKLATKESANRKLSALMPGKKFPRANDFSSLEEGERVERAKRLISRLFPLSYLDIAANLIGRHNARQGARTLFAILQNKRLLKVKQKKTPLRFRLFPPNSPRGQELTDSPVCRIQHLIFSIVDEVVAVVFPEIAARSSASPSAATLHHHQRPLFIS